MQITVAGFVLGGLLCLCNYSLADIKQPHVPMYAWLLKVDSTGREDWHRVFGYPNESHVETAIRLTDGGYAFIGGINVLQDDLRWSSTVPWIVVIDSLGNVRWDKKVVPADSCAAHGTSLAQSPGGFVVAGEFHETTHKISSMGNLWAARLNKSGKMIWTLLLPDTTTVIQPTIVSTPDGGVLMTAVVEPERNEGPNSPDRDKSYVEGQLVKLSGDGKVEWKRNYGRDDWRVFNSICPARPAGYLIVGSTGFGASSYTAYSAIGRFDENGNQQWKKEHQHGKFCNIRCIVSTDNGYLLSGEADSQVFQMTLDTSGDTLWSKSYLEGGSCSAVPTHDGGSILVGATFKYGAGSSDGFLIKTDSLGNEQWHRTYGGTELDQCRMVFPTSDGGYILVGSTGSFTE